MHATGSVTGHGVELGRFESDSGTIVVERPAPRVILTTITGHCTLEHALTHVNAATTLYAQDLRLHHFFDVEQLRGYDSDARSRLTSFAIAQRQHVLTAHFLIRSRLVAMGVATAAVAARVAGMSFESTSVRGEFEAALDVATRD